MTRPMPLCHALRVLAETHTTPDSEVGFRVHSIPAVLSGGWGPWGTAEYIDAWSVVRTAIGLPTEPDRDTAPPLIGDGERP